MCLKWAWPLPRPTQWAAVSLQRGMRVAGGDDLRLGAGRRLRRREASDGPAWGRESLGGGAAQRSLFEGV